MIYLEKIWRGKNTTTDQQEQTRAHKKHGHHDPPRPPASSGFNCIGKFDRRTLRNPPRSLQHGDAIFYVKLTISLFY